MQTLKEINKKLKELKKERPLDFAAINKLEYEKYKLKQQEKAWKKKTKSQLENEMRKKKVVKADAIFSKFIRLRDTKGRKVRCVTYENHWDKATERITFHTCHCCHWISRGWWSERYNEENCFAGCWYCNTYDQENHHNALTAMQVRIHWLAWVERKLREKNKIKPNMEELDLIIDYYTKRYKDLCIKYDFHG